MSEKINLPHENLKIPEIPKHNHETKRTHEKSKAEKPVEHEHRKDIDNISRKVETSAKSSKELQQATDTNKTEETPAKFAPGSQLKQSTLSHSLKKVRKELKSYQRPFSRIIHNDVVEAVSEVSEKTIARPSGLLAGGLASFLISAATLWICRYYGYEYNYYIGLASFAAGFVIGIAGEFITKPLRRS